jgi:hypothetical protein
MGKPTVRIDLRAQERAAVEGLVGRRRTAQGTALRVGIVRAAADGLENEEIYRPLSVERGAAGNSRQRYAQSCMDRVHDEPRPGAPLEADDDEIAETICLMPETVAEGATRWSLPVMAKAVGHASSTIRRFREAHSVQPHRVEAFNLSSEIPDEMAPT